MIVPRFVPDDELKWKLGGDMFEEDNLLDPLDFKEIITTLCCNCKVIDEKAVRETVKEIIDIRMQDFQYILNNNIDEIIAEAKKRRSG